MCREAEELGTSCGWCDRDECPYHEHLTKAAEAERANEVKIESTATRAGKTQRLKLRTLFDRACRNDPIVSAGLRANMSYLDIIAMMFERHEIMFGRLIAAVQVAGPPNIAVKSPYGGTESLCFDMFKAGMDSSWKPCNETQKEEPEQ